MDSENHENVESKEQITQPSAEQSTVNGTEDAKEHKEDSNIIDVIGNGQLIKKVVTDFICH